MLKSDCAEAAVSLLLPLSLSFSLSYFASVSFTDSSILCLPPHCTHTHLLYSLSIRSVITGQCQHLKTVVLAEPVSSQVELTIFPVPDCLIPALLYTPSRSTDREKAYWLLLKAWYNSKCLPICGRLCSFWPYNKGTKTERAEIQT